MANDTSNTSDQTLAEQLAALKAENDRLKARDALSLKVSDKGGVSIYNVRARFPITLYPSELAQIFSARAQIEKFVADNSEIFSAKEAEKEAAKEAAAAEKAAEQAAKDAEKKTKTKARQMSPAAVEALNKMLASGVNLETAIAAVKMLGI